MADPPVMIVGVSRSLLQPADQWDWPLHGLRHPPAGKTSGWYCWTGNLLATEDFFVPLHQRHLIARWPAVERYLLSDQGTRFLLTPDYSDVWVDDSLLDV
ncbi:immunity protein Imm33 domain-containing protein [Nakamurella panacisegetis]|uniref:immunity protein Imm33 domain-containing protein n=1 Tax=Nakamurella panacisegetis TaxID=1090615 RepID=UPI0012FD23E3|nr:hypothetical protein [Nakamurella panacisegetis]